MAGRPTRLLAAITCAVLLVGCGGREPFFDLSEVDPPLAGGEGYEPVVPVPVADDEDDDPASRAAFLTSWCTAMSDIAVGDPERATLTPVQASAVARSPEPSGGRLTHRTIVRLYTEHVDAVSQNASDERLADLEQQLREQLGLLLDPLASQRGTTEPCVAFDQQLLTQDALELASALRALSLQQGAEISDAAWVQANLADAAARALGSRTAAAATDDGRAQVTLRGVGTAVCLRPGEGRSQHEVTPGPCA